MIAARKAGSLAYLKVIEEMVRGLNSIIEGVGHAVYVEVLRLANETSKLSFFNLSIVDPQEFGAERAKRERAEQRRIEKSKSGRSPFSGV